MTTHEISLFMTALYQAWVNYNFIVIVIQLKLIIIYHNSNIVFLPARRIGKRGLCYGNVSVWLAGWLPGWVGVCYTPVLYQNG